MTISARANDAGGVTSKAGEMKAESLVAAADTGGGTGSDNLTMVFGVDTGSSSNDRSWWQKTWDGAKKSWKYDL